MSRVLLVALIAATACEPYREAVRRDEQARADRTGCDHGDAEACFRASDGVTWEPQHLADINRACDLGLARACNITAQWHAQDSAWLTRACDLGAPSACGRLAAISTDRATAAALRERSCSLDAKTCSYQAGEALRDDPALARRLAERACAGVPDECPDAQRLILEAKQTCPRLHPDCELPPLTLEDRCLGYDREACIALGRRLSGRQE